MQFFLVLLAAPFVFDAVRRAGLSRRDPVELAIWVGLTTLLFAASLLTRDQPQGVSLHFSGAAFLALCLGYARALLSLSLLLLITQPWSTMGVALLTGALMPVWLMLMLLEFTRRYLPANPFVFLLGCGFFGLFLVYGAQVIVSAALPVAYQGVSLHSAIFSEQTIWSLLLASGEATLEGMIITILVVYYPRAVVTFDDTFYLTRPM